MLFISGLGMTFVGMGQDMNNISRLKMSLDTAQWNTERVDLLNELAKEYLTNDLSESLLYGNKALAISDSLNYDLGTATALKDLGTAYYSRGNYPKALNYLVEALKGFKQVNDSLQIADVYISLGNIYANTDNFQEGKRYYEQADIIYHKLNDFKKQADIINNLATIFLEVEEPDSALLYLDQSVKAYRELNDQKSLTTSYINIGFAYSLKGRFKEAIEYYRKSYDLAIENDQKENLAISLLNLGDSYMNLGELDMAKEYVDKGLEISNKEGLKYNQYIGTYTLGEIAEKNKDYKSAVKWYKKAEEFNEELNSVDTKNALLKVQSDQLEASSERELKRVKTINEASLRYERLKTMLTLTGASLVLILFLGTTYFFMRKHRTALKIALQNKEISEQKNKIEEQSTRISKANKILKERNSELRGLNEDKNQLMSMVAHDLKSPLNQINGLAAVINLETENLTETQKECLDKISVASERLSQMINKVLDTKAIDSGEENMIIEKINLKDVVADLVRFYSSKAQSKNIRVRTNLKDKNLFVKADKQYIRQIIENLMSNALKFSPNNTSIEINSYVKEGEIVTEVKDQGPGLSDEDKKHLFQEYATLSAEPTGDEISTGLGLSIVKKYVDKLGGKVWCESDPGQGASFKVKFQAV